MKTEVTGFLPPLAILAGFVLSGAGCGDADEGPLIHPVSGKVLVDGKPAANARVSFHSSTAAIKAAPYAEADLDGAFRPSTRMTGDGAPAGDYTVTIVWPRITVDHGEEIAGPDRLGGRYSSPQSSNLKVTVKEGENLLPSFELKSR